MSASLSTSSILLCNIIIFGQLLEHTRISNYFLTLTKENLYTVKFYNGNYITTNKPAIKINTTT